MDTACATAPTRTVVPAELPPSVWRGSDIQTRVRAACSTGWKELDNELPGGGWPAQGLTEVLSPQSSVVEWRLLGHGLAHRTATGGQVILIGPPKDPHLPGLLHHGLRQAQVVWIKADTPAERLWAVEQLIKSNAAGAIVAWLPHARQEQIRRLQVCALSCEAPVFLFRPEAARHESSAAPLRLMVEAGLDWELLVHVFKRRGPVHDGVLRLRSVPGGLADIITPRIERPSRLLPAIPELETLGALGSLASRRRSLVQLHA